MASDERNWPLALVLLDGTVLATSTHEIGAALAKRGLHVVTDADMQLLALIKDPPRLIQQLSGELEAKGLRIATRAERAALDAMRDDPDQFCADARYWCDEIAPREAKRG